jgi:hypothetical protein
MRLEVMRLVGFLVVVSLIVVGSSASAVASSPMVATDGAHATGATTATFEGNGDPEGPRRLTRKMACPRQDHDARIGSSPLNVVGFEAQDGAGLSAPGTVYPAI